MRWGAKEKGEFGPRKEKQLQQKHTNGGGKEYCSPRGRGNRIERSSSELLCFGFKTKRLLFFVGNYRWAYYMWRVTDERSSRCLVAGHVDFICSMMFYLPSNVPISLHKACSSTTFVGCQRRRMEHRWLSWKEWNTMTRIRRGLVRWLYWYMLNCVYKHLIVFLNWQTETNQWFPGIRCSHWLLVILVPPYRCMTGTTCLNTRMVSFFGTFLKYSKWWFRWPCSLCLP